MDFLFNLRTEYLKVLYLDHPIVFYTTMISMLLITIPFIFAILQLLHIQIGNFRAGLTTNERFGRKVYQTNMHAQGIQGVGPFHQN